MAAPSIGTGLSLIERILPVGTLLDRLDKSIQRSIICARDAGIALEVEAGTQVISVLDNFKSKYYEILDTTFVKVDEETQKILIKIKVIVEEFCENIHNRMRNIASRAEEIVRIFENTVIRLPLTNKSPILSKITPKYLASSKSEPKEKCTKEEIPINFYGSFPLIQNWTVSLKLNGKKFEDKNYPASQDVRNLITILVPQHLFTNSEKKINYVLGRLTFTKKDDSWLSFMYKKAKPIQHEFHNICIGVLPESIGKIRLETSEETYRRKEEKYTSAVHTVRAEDKNQAIIDEIIQVRPNKGWQIVNGSHEFKILDSKNVSVKDISDDENGLVRYRIFTPQKNFLEKFFGSSSDFISYQYTFKQYKNVFSGKYTMEKRDLYWGDVNDQVMKVPHPDNGHWKVNFKAFDGSRCEYVAPAKNSYITITKPLHDHISIRAINAKDFEK